MIYTYFLHFLIFMLGASFASFIFVFLEKAEKSEMLSIQPRSKCMNCKKKLSFYELIPVFSYVFLKGRCSQCKTQIPANFFLGEIILGVWFLFSTFYFLNFSSFIYTNIILSWVFGALFFVLVLEDLEKMEVTSKIIYLLLVVSIIKCLLTSVDIYALLIIAPFWLIYLANKNAIGQADPYVYTALALFFGTQFTISLSLYSVWFGAVYGLGYLLLVEKKIKRNVRIPFLPIIFAATLFILITNFHIIKIQDILLLNEILSF